jgi:hypothetical protein
MIESPHFLVEESLHFDCNQTLIRESCILIVMIKQLKQLIFFLKNLFFKYTISYEVPVSTPVVINQLWIDHWCTQISFVLLGLFWQETWHNNFKQINKWPITPMEDFFKKNIPMEDLSFITLYYIVKTKQN